MYIQAREESKPRNLSETGSLYTIAQTTRRNYWCNITYSVTDKLTFKTRAQFNTFSIGEKPTQGMVLLQDVNYSIGKFQINARHALFDAEDYDNRQYVYENDAWLAFSMPAYYGVGIRNYLLVEYKFNKKMSMWVRYARTRYTDREIIGSGADAINGNVKRDIKVQMLFRF
jgi:predicted porin